MRFLYVSSQQRGAENTILISEATHSFKFAIHSLFVERIVNTTKIEEPNVYVTSVRALRETAVGAIICLGRLVLHSLGCRVNSAVR